MIALNKIIVLVTKVEIIKLLRTDLRRSHLIKIIQIELALKVYRNSMY